MAAEIKKIGTQQNLQININFFLKTNAWISYIAKSHFRSVERFWTHVHIAHNIASYHGLRGHQPHSQGFFPITERFIGFLLQSIVLC